MEKELLHVDTLSSLWVSFTNIVYQLKSSLVCGQGGGCYFSKGFADSLGASSPRKYIHVGVSAIEDLFDFVDGGACWGKSLTSGREASCAWC